MKKPTKYSIIKLSVAILSFIAILFLAKYLPAILELTLSVDKFRNYIVSLGSLGFIVFTLFQVLQTVIAPIPGEVIQVAGGYIYGVPLGIFFTTVGLLIGSIIAFYFTRFIGGSYIEKLLSRKNSQWMKDIMDSKKFSVLLFVIFLVPGLPKDFMIYVAGLTPIKPLRFFGILLISRFPWLLASVSIGSNLHHKEYLSTAIISAIALISFILGIIYKDKIINKFSTTTAVQESN